MKFSKEQLKGALLGDFKFGRDLKVAYEGTQLVETKREGGCFVHTDFSGAPKLKHEFADYLDENDTGTIASYQQARDVWEAMRHQEPLAHAAMHWYIFERSSENTQVKFAERLGFSDRTIRNLITKGVDFMDDGIKNGVRIVVVPPPPVYLAA